MTRMGADFSQRGRTARGVEDLPRIEKCRLQETRDARWADYADHGGHCQDAKFVLPLTTQNTQKTESGALK
jgi:hypothetical protein